MDVKEELGAFILENFALRPTKEQLQVVQMWCDFLLSTHREEIFLLQGYAGTGKTSLVGALVKSLVALRRPVVLLAPTGRAAKVFSLHADHVAYTIHKKIYRQKTFSAEMVNFQSNVNNHRHTLFIVDEASMINNDGISGRMFGTGRLLDDLVHYVYAGEGCRLMLVGDSAQLPPVGEELSPALNPLALAGYGMEVREATLTQVLRQADESGILWNATLLRKLISIDGMGDFPRFRITGFPDIRVVPGDELIEFLEDSYYRYGTDQTIVVTRSNRRANIFNNGIRGRILQYEEELCSGDQLIVVKNNYFWTDLLPVPHEEGRSVVRVTSKKGPLPLTGESEGASFIANGDVCVVRRFRNERSLYGFRFADATLRFPDFEDMEIETTILLDTLQSEAPALTQEQQTQLFNAVCADYPELHSKRDLMEKVKQDPYYNALQVKFSYAVTCHKAQGGQWQCVFIDQGYVTQDMLTPDYFRWLYTALTRATEQVYLINWPKEQIGE
ncbi:MAG: AAA family ATPase [Bacteroidaceae bacterium]|nr:AAA family ATPase [Bacteroidaceae bacterium]